MAATLTEKIVLNAESSEKPYEIPDRGSKHSIKGLILRVQPSGVKTYYVQIGRGSREKIGDASVYTLTKARVKAKSKQGKAADGHDFQAERRRKKELDAATLEGYLNGPFKVHAESNIASHKDMLARVNRGFKFALDKPMIEISELDMARWRKQRSKVSLETQRRELTYLKAVLNHAVRERAIPGHQLGQYRVIGTLKDGEGDSNVRFLSATEEKHLRSALDVREERIRQERAAAPGSLRLSAMSPSTQETISKPRPPPV